tara:strand:+ start:950 stop:1108 length:159 start_codon:yes stop_codon:yes gene_type:complete
MKETKKTTKKVVKKENKEDKRIQDLEEIVVGMGARLKVMEELYKRVKTRMGL